MSTVRGEGSGAVHAEAFLQEDSLALVGKQDWEEHTEAVFQHLHQLCPLKQGKRMAELSVKSSELSAIAQDPAYLAIEAQKFEGKAGIQTSKPIENRIKSLKKGAANCDQFIEKSLSKMKDFLGENQVNSSALSSLGRGLKKVFTSKTEKRRVEESLNAWEQLISFQLLKVWKSFAQIDSIDSPQFSQALEKIEELFHLLDRLNTYAKSQGVALPFANDKHMQLFREKLLDLENASSEKELTPLLTAVSDVTWRQLESITQNLALSRTEASILHQGVTFGLARLQTLIEEEAFSSSESSQLSSASLEEIPIQETKEETSSTAAPSLKANDSLSSVIESFDAEEKMASTSSFSEQEITQAVQAIQKNFLRQTPVGVAQTEDGLEKMRSCLEQIEMLSFENQGKIISEIYLHALKVLNEVEILRVYYGTEDRVPHFNSVFEVANSIVNNSFEKIENWLDRITQPDLEIDQKELAQSIRTFEPMMRLQLLFALKDHGQENLTEDEKMEIQDRIKYYFERLGQLYDVSQENGFSLPEVKKLFSSEEPLSLEQIEAKIREILFPSSYSY